MKSINDIESAIDQQNYQEAQAQIKVLISQNAPLTLEKNDWDRLVACNWNTHLKSCKSGDKLITNTTNSNTSLKEYLENFKAIMSICPNTTSKEITEVHIPETPIIQSKTSAALQVGPKTGHIVKGTLKIHQTHPAILACHDILLCGKPTETTNLILDELIAWSTPNNALQQHTTNKRKATEGIDYTLTKIIPNADGEKNAKGKNPKKAKHGNKENNPETKTPTNNVSSLPSTIFSSPGTRAAARIMTSLRPSNNTEEWSANRALTFTDPLSPDSALTVEALKELRRGTPIPMSYDDEEQDEEHTKDTTRMGI